MLCNVETCQPFTKRKKSWTYMQRTYIRTYVVHTYVQRMYNVCTMYSQYAECISNVSLAYCMLAIRRVYMGKC